MIKKVAEIIESNTEEPSDNIYQTVLLCDKHELAEKIDALYREHYQGIERVCPDIELMEEIGYKDCKELKIDCPDTCKGER